MLHQKNLFFVCMYKIVDIGKETWKQRFLSTYFYNKCLIEVIIDGIDTLWLNEKHIKEKLGHENLPATRNKYDQTYKKHRYELVVKQKSNQTEDFYVVIWH